MSRILTLELSDTAYAAISRQAETTGTSPARLAATSLEQQFGASSGLRDGSSLPTEAEKQAARAWFERHFGAVNLGDATGADNESIDADLAREYAELGDSNGTSLYPGTPVTINELWHSTDERAWAQALERYMRYVKPADVELVRELEPLDLKRVRQLDAQDWYDFLFHKYFRWKYTAPNRLATTRRSLAKYIESGTLDELFRIKEQLLSFPKEDIAQGLSIASSIRGLGIAGASGLLTLMYPEHFGTVDQFVVKALREVEDLPQRASLDRMNPEGLRPYDGILLIQIMRNKAAANNRAFETDTWTPKKIDEILWTYGR